VLGEWTFGGENGGFDAMATGGQTVLEK